MSEYRFVEEPFLSQLAALGWDIIDQGEGIPRDPAASLGRMIPDQVYYDLPSGLPKVT